MFVRVIRGRSVGFAQSTLSRASGNQCFGICNDVLVARHTMNGQRTKSTMAADNGELSLEDRLPLIRNIGISAHIDSGKTTLTERVLFYGGRINQINDVKGKDGVSGKMDSMALEIERGITIQSAATFLNWKENFINIIDTPGHIDFQIEVSRSLRVLDGAILVLCAVGGVQSQTLTVDRQMKQYGVPRIAFINKLDRMGANPDKAVKMIRQKLFLNAAAVQVPIGLEGDHKGVVDIVRQCAYYFEGDFGEKVRTDVIPEKLKGLVAEKRHLLIENLAEVDEEIEDVFLMEEEPDVDTLVKAIRRQTLAHKFVPVFMGSAFKNKGVQPLLDGVDDYLPSPLDREYSYLDQNEEEKEKPMLPNPNDPLIMLAFKLEDGRFGQLTYVRVYQGTLKRGMFIRNTATGKRVKLPRLVRMHSNEMEEVQEVGPGEICALFGVECSSGDTFCAADDAGFNPTLESMHVPDPVVSLAVSPKNKSDITKFSKALSKFSREDPSFRVSQDAESQETIIAGMGELMLEIYIERMKREFECEVVAGAPKVNYREQPQKKVEFNYLHKKQSGGAGQFARVIGYMEPLNEEERNAGKNFEFINGIIGNSIPPEYIKAVEKGFEEALEKGGGLIGAKVSGVRVVLQDGEAHSVDSSEMAFRTAASGAFREAYSKANGAVLEPIMKVEVVVPTEFQGSVAAQLNRMRGIINDTEAGEGNCIITASCPLREMFGYTTTLRSATQAKGEFSMEFQNYSRMPTSEQEKLINEINPPESKNKKK